MRYEDGSSTKQRVRLAGASLILIAIISMSECHANVLDDMILNMDTGVRTVTYETTLADPHDAAEEYRSKTKYEALRTDGEYYVLEPEFSEEKNGRYIHTFRAGHGYALYGNEYYKGQYDKIKDCKARIKPVTGNRYTKIKKIYQYITENVKYGKNYDSYSAFSEKSALCEGQAALFYRLCLMNDIPCRMVYGKAYGIKHAWNAVKLDEWYYVDTTNRKFLKGSETLGKYVPEEHIEISKTDKDIRS